MYSESIEDHYDFSSGTLGPRNRVEIIVKRESKMRLELFGERIAVKQHDEETVTASGLILAIDAGKKHQGNIVACGAGKFMDSGVVRPMLLKIGDVVLFGEYSGQKFSLDGEEYLMMNESDVLGVLK